MNLKEMVDAMRKNECHDDVDCSKEMADLLMIYLKEMNGRKDELDREIHGMVYFLRQFVEKYDSYQEMNHKYQDLKEKLVDGDADDE